jgi:hypothetical protein
MLPRVGAESSMKACRPMRIVLTDHMGFQVSGWKSDLREGGREGGRAGRGGCASWTRIRKRENEEDRERKEGKNRGTYIERQRRVLGLNRPEGVSIRIEGGLRGYSGGNLSLPW